MPDKYANYRSNPDSLGTNITEYTAADVDLPDNVKAVFFDADGTVSIKPSGGGTTITGIPFVGGSPLPWVPGRITAFTGATKCYLIT
jgi:hypothetical protein